MNQQDYQFIGVDIAKDSLKMQSPTRACCVPYTQAGLAKLLKELTESQQRPWVLCEATVGYERELLAVLWEKGIAVTLLNSARVRAFAKSEGLHAKTDALDAQVLLHFAQQKKLKPPAPECPRREQLVAFLDRRSQISEHLAREKNRLQRCPVVIETSVQTMIQFIEQQLRHNDGCISEVIEQGKQLQTHSATLQTGQRRRRSERLDAVGLLARTHAIAPQ